MAHLPIEFCRRVAQERRAKGITQSALARSAGCAQSAMSMFESGHPEKLSMEFVKRVAEILEIPLEEKSTILPDFESRSEGVKKGYCPNAGCLSNIPFVINGVPVVHPTLKSAGEQSRYCTVCGEVLESSCPECGQSVTEGAFCGRCGKARITVVVPSGILPERWAAERRAEIAEFRHLSDRQ